MHLVVPLPLQQQPSLEACLLWQTHRQQRQHEMLLQVQAVMVQGTGGSGTITLFQAVQRQHQVHPMPLGSSSAAGVSRELQYTTAVLVDVCSVCRDAA